MSYSKDRKGNPIEQPRTYNERARLASLCIKDAGITVPMLVDRVDNSVWQEFGPAPNLAYLIGTDKKVVAAQQWYNTSEMELDIKRYLGE